METFIEKNKREPFRYDADERGKYSSLQNHNRKLYEAGVMKEESVEK